MHEFLVRHQAAIGAPIGVILMGCLLLVIGRGRRTSFIVMAPLLAVSPLLGAAVLGAMLS